jgi:hypothetical protein
MVDLWLQQQPTGAVFETPNGFSGNTEYYTLHNQQPSVLGYGTFPPPLYFEVRGTLNNFPSDSAIEVLQRWQTSYIVVDKYTMHAQYGGNLWWQQFLDDDPRLQLLYDDDFHRVYGLWHVPYRNIW